MKRVSQFSRALLTLCSIGIAGVVGGCGITDSPVIGVRGELVPVACGDAVFSTHETADPVFAQLPLTQATICPWPVNPNQSIKVVTDAAQLNALTKALSNPDLTQTIEGACTLEAMLLPAIVVQDSQNRLINAHVPTGKCGKPLSDIKQWLSANY